MDKHMDSSNKSQTRNDNGDVPIRESDSSSGNNNIDLGCGQLSSKIANGITSSTAAAAAAATAKKTIPLPLGAPLPNGTAPSASAASSSLARFVLNSQTANSASSSFQQFINLNISTTTGGNFDVTVDPNITVENLKKIIAKKLKVAKDRIRLLHRERELQDGTVKDNNLMDGSKIILIPNVETGLLAQRPENTVMQALESLNDSQVNDFLSGKTPLNLSMRLGDHMMLIQLQLSTVNPANASTSSHGASNGSSCSSSRTSRSSSQRSSGTRSNSLSGSSNGPAGSNHHTHHHHHHHHHLRSNTQQTIASGGANTSAAATTTTSSTMSSSSSSTVLRKAIAGEPILTEHCNVNAASRLSAGSSSTNATTFHNRTGTLLKNADLSSFLSKRDYESLKNIVKSFTMSQPSRMSVHQANISQQSMANNQPLRTPVALPTKASSFPTSHSHSHPHPHPHPEPTVLEQSPIKSLSNLVSSSPIEATAMKIIPIAANCNNNLTNMQTASSSVASSASAIPTTVVQSASTATAATPTPMLTCQDPIAAKLTSCLCTRLNATNGSIAVKNCIESACISRQDVAMINGVPAQRPSFSTTTSGSANKVISSASSSNVSVPLSSAAMLHKTANNPIIRSKHRHHYHHHHHHHHYHHNGPGGSSNSVAAPTILAAAAGAIASRPKGLPSTTTATSAAAVAATPRRVSSNTSLSSNDSGFTSDDSMLGTTSAQSTNATANAATTTTTTTTAAATTTSSLPIATQNVTARTSQSSSTDLDLESGFVNTDTRTLAEASRNLAQTLRKLSKEVFTNKIDLSSSNDEAQRKSGSGAVIESMKNHGKGIYSGTFSGTLNPALQDRYGRPKRDISTVIHILNDLLSATPQYSRGARISFEAPSNLSSTSAAGNSSGIIGSSSSAPYSTSRSKQLPNKHHHVHSHAQSCIKCIKSQASFGQHPPAGGSTNCVYGECNGHYTNSGSVSNKPTLRTPQYACCSSGLLLGSHSNGNHHSDSNANPNDRSVCSCRYRNDGGETNGSGEREREHTCQKCLDEMQNLRTKSKVDQLRLVMQQRKQKREARKLKGAPYGARVVGTTATTSNLESTDISGAASKATTLAAAVASAATTSTSLSNTSSSSSSSSSTSTSKTLTTAPPSEVSPNHIVEEVDTAA